MHNNTSRGQRRAVTGHVIGNPIKDGATHQAVFALQLPEEEGVRTRVNDHAWRSLRRLVEGRQVLCLFMGDTEIKQPHSGAATEHK